MKTIIVLSLALIMVGCTNVQPAPLVQEDPNSLARTCVSPNGQLMDEHYCDPVWIAQQQAIARQQNNTDMLNTLLLYHFVYGGTINNGYVTHYYTTVPHGYSYHPYNRNTTVINKTTVNNYHAAPPAASRSYSSAKPSYSYGSGKPSYSSSGSGRKR